MQCYSCHDQMKFQMIGQTAAYNPAEQAKRYMDRFQLLGSHPITCDLCSRTVTYSKQFDDVWIEEEVPKEPNT